MVDILNFSIFDLVGLGDVTGIELIFATSALIGGILFTLYFFLLMVGGIATDIFDGLFGLDVDMGADASFKALTFQGIMAFLMFFGLGGLYVLRTDSDATSLAVFAGSVCGDFDVRNWQTLRAIRRLTARWHNRNGRLNRGYRPSIP